MTTNSTLRQLTEPAGSPSTPEPVGHSAKADDEIALLDMLIVVAEHKRMVLLVTAGFAIIAALSH